MSEPTDNSAPDAAKSWLKLPGFWLWLCFISLLVLSMSALSWHYYVDSQILGRRDVQVQFASQGFTARFPTLAPLGRAFLVTLGDRADTDHVIPWLRMQPALKFLRMSVGCCSARSLSLVAENCSYLEDLVIFRNFTSVALGEKECEQIAKVSSLQRLTFYTEIEGDGLGCLARLPNLKELVYFPPTITSNPLLPVMGIGHLESVESLMLNLTDAELQSMLADRSDGRPVLPRLKKLSITEPGHYGLRENRLSRSTMRLVTKLSQLEAIYLVDIKVSIEGIRELVVLPNLRQLIVGERSCSQQEINSLPSSFLSRCKIQQIDDKY